MYRLLMLFSCLILSCSSLPTTTLIKGMFSTTQTGDLTYYGGTTGGNCGYGALLPPWVGSVTQIAMNKIQYASNDVSQGCGVCISYKGTGTGSGAVASKPSTSAITGYVTDQCPECLKGSIDIGKSGDGRWGVSWKAVACPVGSYPLYYKFEGSNDYYLKMQVVGHRIPINGVTFSWSSGSLVGARSQDNFFVASGGPIKYPLTVTVTGTNGEVVTEVLSISSVTTTSLITGKKQFTGTTGAVEDVNAQSATDTNTVLVVVLVVMCVMIALLVVGVVVLTLRKRKQIENV